MKQRVDTICLHLALTLPSHFPTNDFPNSTQHSNKGKGSLNNSIQNPTSPLTKNDRIAGVFFFLIKMQV